MDDNLYCDNLIYNDGWIYYTRSDGIYKIRTDGADKKLRYTWAGRDGNVDYCKIITIITGKGKILYTYSDDYEQTVYLYMINKDGTNKTRLRKIDGNQYVPIYSNNSDYLYVYEFGAIFCLSPTDFLSFGKLYFHACQL